MHCGAAKRSSVTDQYMSVISAICMKTSYSPTLQQCLNTVTRILSRQRQQSVTVHSATFSQLVSLRSACVHTV